MKHCVQCKGTKLERAEQTIDIQVPTGEKALAVSVAGVSVIRCSTCGEAYLHGRDLERAALIAGAEAIRRGAQDGTTFRFVRKALGMEASELGELLGISPNVVSQWEDGRRAVERSVWIALGHLMADQLSGATTTIDELRAFVAPLSPPPLRFSLQSFRDTAPEEHHAESP